PPNQRFMVKISSRWVAVDDENQNSLELVFLFDNAAIDRGSPDTNTVKPDRREKLAFPIVNLPIVGRPFGAHIVIDIASHCTHHLSLNHPRIKRDEPYRMLLRSDNRLLLRGVIAKRDLLRSNSAVTQ